MSNNDEKVRPLYPAGIEETAEEAKEYPEEDWPAEREFEEDNDKDKDIIIAPLFPNGINPE
jgi:hypothetical protein